VTGEAEARSASAGAAGIALLVRSGPTSLRLATVDAEGREGAWSNDLAVANENHPARYRLALSAGGSGTVAAPFGARRVFATIDGGGCRLTEGEPIGLAAVPPRPARSERLRASGIASLRAGWAAALR
jgi:hypothetical protein